VKRDHEAILQAATLNLSVLVGRREGGFILAPKASLSDGWLDYMHVGDLSRWEVIRFLPRLVMAGPPDDHPKVKQGRCQKLKVASERPLAVHVDGELFCVPEDNVRAVEIEVMPAALTIAKL